MSTPPDDLDARLARREPLFRASGTGEPLEPPAEVDRLVLARARAALRAAGGDEASRPGFFFTLRPWVLPLGLAATLLFALAVIVRLGPDGGAPASGAVAEADLRSDARDADAVPAAPAPAAPAPAADEPRAANAEAKRAVASPRTREVETGKAAAEQPAAARSQSQATLAASAPPPPAPPAPAALADASQDRLDKAAGGAGLIMQSSEASALRNEAADIQDTPELWYRKILELRDKGLRREAEREWRALKARYPDFEPPPRTTAQ